MEPAYIILISFFIIVIVAFVLSLRIREKKSTNVIPSKEIFSRNTLLKTQREASLSGKQNSSILNQSCNQTIVEGLLLTKNDNFKIVPGDYNVRTKW